LVTAYKNQIRHISHGIAMGSRMLAARAKGEFSLKLSYLTRRKGQCSYAHGFTVGNYGQGRPSLPGPLITTLSMELYPNPKDFQECICHG
jgi:hypothetical protein